MKVEREGERSHGETSRLSSPPPILYQTDDSEHTERCHECSRPHGLKELQLKQPQHSPAHGSDGEDEEDDPRSIGPALRASAATPAKSPAEKNQPSGITADTRTQWPIIVSDPRIRLPLHAAINHEWSISPTFCFLTPQQNPTASITLLFPLNGNKPRPERNLPLQRDAIHDTQAFEPTRPTQEERGFLLLLFLLPRFRITIQTKPHRVPRRQSKNTAKPRPPIYSRPTRSNTIRTFISPKSPQCPSIVRQRAPR